MLSPLFQILIQNNIQYLGISNNDDNYDLQIFIVNAYGLKYDELPVQLEFPGDEISFRNLRNVLLVKLFDLTSTI